MLSDMRCLCLNAVLNAPENSVLPAAMSAYSRKRAGLQADYLALVKGRCGFSYMRRQPA
jgi:hypothetical protein